MKEIPASMTDRLEIEFSRQQKLVIIGGVILSLIVLPLFIESSFLMNVFLFIFLFAAMGSGWNIIGGYTGQFSIGHAVMFAIGAYTTAVLFVYFGISPLVGILIGGVIATLWGILLGATTFHLRYHYFAMATLASALIALIVFQRWEWVGGAGGIEYPIDTLGDQFSLTYRGKEPYYYIFGGYLLIVLSVVYILDKSKLGIYLQTIKLDEDAAKNAGLHTYRYKLYAMGLSSCIVGIAGGLFVQLELFVNPEMTLRILRNIEIILIPVIGGVGTVFGPLIGAVIFVPVQEYARARLGATYTGLGWTVIGVILLLISIYRPGGILNKFD